MYQPNANLIDVTPTLDTSIYASGDTLFDSTVITNAVPIGGAAIRLTSIVLIDKDDQGAALDLYILDSNLPFGTLNAAPSISDANADNMLAHIAVAAGDWKDLGGARVAVIENIQTIVKPSADGRDLYVAATTGGTPTHTASGLVLRFGFEWLR